MEEIDDEQEIEWTLNALVRYLVPKTTTWTDRHGSEISLDRLTGRLLDQGIGIGSCYGTHAIYTLAVVAHIDNSNAILSQPTRSRLESYFAAVRASLQLTQTPRGSWPKKWHPDVQTYAIETRINMPSFQQEDFQEIFSTGHHLDWIAIAPARLRPNVQSIRRASRYALSELQRLPHDKLSFFYFLFTHVARGLCLLAGKHPAELLSSASPHGDKSAGGPEGFAVGRPELLPQLRRPECGAEQ